jgi:response regulator RpfG family c-di-GMP phosphodiesterase
MNNKILLVDDEINILNSFKRILRNRFPFDIAQSGDEALALIDKNSTYAVVVSDMRMPGMDGITLLNKIKEVSPNTTRIMLTGNADQQTAIDAVNVGDVFKFMNKPCNATNFINTLESGVAQYKLVIAEKILLNKTLKETMNVLSEVLTIVNPEVFSRVVLIKQYMLKLAKNLKMPISWSFEPMIQLSQLGCIVFPSKNTNVANKGLPNTGSKFSREHDKLVMEHPGLAADLIHKIPRMGQIAKTIRYQNKGFNGEGSPFDDVKGKEIPIGARMLKIVIDFLDFVDKGASQEQATLMLEEQPALYDPDLLKAFRDAIDIPQNEETTMIALTELSVDMIIQEDIRTEADLMVAAKGQQVTEALLRIINHCLKNKALSGKTLISKQSNNSDDET